MATFWPLLIRFGRNTYKLPAMLGECPIPEARNLCACACSATWQCWRCLPARESFVATVWQPEAYLVRRLDISTQQVQPRQPHATSALMDLERDLEGRVYSRRLAERPTNSLHLGAYLRCPTNSVTHGSRGKQSAVALRLSPILTALLVLMGCH